MFLFCSHAAEKYFLRFFVIRQRIVPIVFAHCHSQKLKTRYGAWASIISWTCLCSKLARFTKCLLHSSNIVVHQQIPQEVPQDVLHKSGGFLQCSTIFFTSCSHDCFLWQRIHSIVLRRASKNSVAVKHISLLCHVHVDATYRNGRKEKQKLVCPPKERFFRFSKNTCNFLSQLTPWQHLARFESHSRAIDKLKRLNSVCLASNKFSEKMCG